MITSKHILTFALSVLFSLHLSAHSTSGFFVTNGSDCYFVMTNWHSGLGEQTTSTTNNDGVYFDFNLDGMYNGSVDPMVGPFPTGSGAEYYPFAQFIDVSNLSHAGANAATSIPIWKTEIEDWFTANIGTGFTATNVWDPSADVNCQGQGTSYYALVSPLGVCPTVAGNYFATVADGSVTSEPCGMTVGAAIGTFDLDLTGNILVPAGNEIPTMGEWGLMSLGLILLILGVLTVRQREGELSF